MKKIHILVLFLLIALLLGSTQLLARNSSVIYTHNYQIDQDLDLNAVASIFGDSSDLYDFEKRLNDPYYQISNLDFNNDGYVDYLRVIETVDGNFNFIVIQAVIGYRHYQDIATIEVDRSYNQINIQIVGNSYIYGPNYIIEPIYSYHPEIFRIFWQPRFYHAYRSNYRWRHYPSYYRPWRPVPVPYYHRHIRKHISHANRYRYTKHRRARHSRKMHNKIRKDNYSQRYPNRSYKHRNSHKNNRKRIDRKKTYRQKDKVKKRRARHIRRSGTVKTRTQSGRRSRSEVKTRTKYREKCRKEHKIHH